MTKAIKYPSTHQFRQVIRTVHDKLTFDGIDEDGNVKRKLVDPSAFLIPYIGTVKIHGTNGSIVFHSEDDVVFQSKERVYPSSRIIAASWRLWYAKILLPCLNR